MHESAFTPEALRQAGARALAVRWADGHESVYDVRELRLACACATCVDEWTRQEKLDPASVPADVRPIAIHPVGRYAIQIDWSDGHSTGIYPFRRLRELCGCASCAGSPP
jgi:ATP-binding protein involved in chromosome partitioning